VALVGEDEATVKRFYREPGGKIRFAACEFANVTYFSCSHGREDSGRVVGVLRKVLIRGS